MVRRVASRLKFYISEWTANPCILHQVCDGRGANLLGRWLLANWDEDETAQCRRPLFTARVQSIASRMHVNSLHALWPIRAPRSTCANQDAWAFVTPRWPNANSIHTPKHERHLDTSFKRLYLSKYLFVYGHYAILAWRDLDLAGGGCSSNKQILQKGTPQSTK